jgi:K+-sensing histidine kinase KdpD
MEEHPKDTFHFDRRSGKDRRSHKMPEIKSLFIYGRRKKIRRQDDKCKITYFDHYSSALFVAIIIILFLNIIDALLTLYLIDHGATEINPVMAYFLNFGPLTFMSVKHFLICFSIIVLLIFNNVFLGKIKIYTRSIFSYVIGAFMLVIGWELFLALCIL